MTRHLSEQGASCTSSVTSVRKNAGTRRLAACQAKITSLVASLCISAVRCAIGAIAPAFRIARPPLDGDLSRGPSLAPPPGPPLTLAVEQHPRRPRAPASATGPHFQTGSGAKHLRTAVRDVVGDVFRCNPGRDAAVCRCLHQDCATEGGELHRAMSTRAGENPGRAGRRRRRRRRSRLCRPPRAAFPRPP